MAGSGLSGEGLTPNPNFNWHFLLELIVSSILVLFFVFYFNRLVATVVSYAIRAFTWHYYRSYVDIGSIQVSLLGGRIFFKDIRYHGVNETVLIHGGFITWNYWTRAVERNDLPVPGREKATENPSDVGGETESLGGQSRSRPRSVAEQGGLHGKVDFPRRVAIQIYGLEWFIYNRTPAYDSILAGFDDAGAQQRQQEDVRDPCRSSGSIRPSKDTRDDKDSALHGNSRPTSPRAKASSHRKDDRPSEAVVSPAEVGETTSRLLQLLPVGLECSKGAIIVGNEHTRSVVAATFDSASGTIDACGAGSLDLYRQIFTFDFRHPVIQFRPNPDFKQSQLSSTGLSSKQDDQPRPRRKREFLFNYHFQKRRVWHSIRDLLPWFQSSVESFHFPQQAREHEYLSPHHWAGASDNVRWAGLSRYLDESAQDDHEGWTDVEYGRFSTIVDSPSMSLSYYWDIPGRVILKDADTASRMSEGSANINGTAPPQWGMDIQLKGGSINYGPWADRERAGLQNVFFPNFYRDSQVAVPLGPGQSRQSTSFTLRLEVTEETILRIPTREQSKDWLWKGRAHLTKGTSKTKKQQRKGNVRSKDGEKSGIGPDLRPFGWLSFSIGPDSTVRYFMDMVASQSGYKNTLMLDIRDSKLSSSVNHGLLWQSSRQLITCDLSNPLAWNTLRTWAFDVESHDMELFLLRDHLFLLTDLMIDWASGPPSDYWTFVPFVYKMNLVFKDLRLCINVNDRNIISNPTDKDDNSFLVIKANYLTSDVRVPLDKLKPDSNSVDFHVKLQDGGIDLTTPVWDTLHTYLREKSTAILDKLVIDGTYHYFSSTSSELTDTLTLDFAGVSPRLYLYGFLIRYFMTITHNYFGDEMHFRTLEEYQERAYTAERSAEITGINPNRKSNDLDVIIHATVENPCAVLPENIYEHVKGLRLSAASLEIDVRFTNYYMDLSATISPVKAALESRHGDGSTTLSGTQLFVDQFSVHGHRLFGLPPSEPTYVCNWDFDIGRVIGECSPEFLSCVIAAVQTFDLTFDNFENALLPLTPLALHDVTFLRADIRSLQLSLLLDHGAVIISTGAMKARFNDWANRRFSKRLGLSVPDITVAAVDHRAIKDYQVSRTPVDPLALFQLTFELKMAQRKSNFFEDRKLQQAHVRIHDQRTHRTPWLLLEQEDDEPDVWSPEDASFDLPNLPVPAMAAPVTNALGSPHLYRGQAFPEEVCKVGIGADESNSTPTVTTDRDVEQEMRFPANTSTLQQAEPIASKSTSQTRLKRQAYVTVGADTSAEASDVNPWSIPCFSIGEILLNRRDFPLENESPILNRVNPTREKSEVIMSQSEEDGMSHVNFSIALPAGLLGLCTPRFLMLVSTMVRQLQPDHPVEILDSLQKSVISDLVGYEKAMRNPKTSTNLAIRIPLISLKLVNYSDTEDRDLNLPEFKDNYHFQISHLRTEFRAKVERRAGDLLGKIKKEHIIRAAVDDLSISVQGGCTNAAHSQAEFKCMLTDTSLWVVSNSRLRSSLQVRAVDFLTATKSAGNFALLVRRTTSMTDSVASAFTRTSSLSSDRLRYLVFSLTQSAAQVADPAFLTRVSSVLRLAPTHLRQHDSWKIISRLRNVYNNVPTSKQSELIAKLSGDDLLLPLNAKSLVLSNFDQWRAWDLAHVAKSYAMRAVWGVLNDIPEEESPATFISCAIERLRIALDPVAHVNDFVIADMSTTLAVTPQAGTAERRGKIFALQSYCSSTSLHFGWEVLELVEGIVKVMSSVNSNPPAASKSRDEPAKSGHSELHIVLGADDGSITLDGINVKLALTGTGLRASFAHKSQAVENATNLSLLLSADTCSSEVTSYEKSLLIWALWQPNAYVSATSRSPNQLVEQDFRIAGSCRRLRFDIMKGPLHLAETADRVIEDEVRQIHHLVKEFDMPASQVDPQGEAKTSKNVRFGLALFLDDYRMSFQILPSLIYIISGEVARMSLSPQDMSKFEIDFDVKGNSHAFMSAEGERWTTLSVLEIPPINGRLLAHALPSRTEIDLDVSIEMIHLEASAVRSLLGALTRPEITHLVSDLQQNVKLMEQHVKDAFDVETVLAQDRRPSTAGHEVVYKGSLTMAGTQIHAMAPGLNGTDYSADMCLSLGLVQARIDNGSAEMHSPEQPSFQIEITRIAMDLRKKSQTESRSYGGFAVDARLTAGSTLGVHGEALRSFDFRSQNFQVELYSETTSLIVDILAHLQERLKTLELTDEVKRFAKKRPKPSQNSFSASNTPQIQVNDEEPTSQDIFDAMYSVELNNIGIGWNMLEDDASERRGRQGEDLVFSIRRLDLSNKKRNVAKLKIEDMLLHMVPFAGNRRQRSLNSALMPELVFNVAYSSGPKEHRLAFQAAGKSLDIRATPEFILPASMVRDSMARATKHLRDANAIWMTTPSTDNRVKRNLFGNKRVRSVLVDVDFAGATVSLLGTSGGGQQTAFAFPFHGSRKAEGKYGQYQGSDAVTTATFKAPGVALKVLFEDNGQDDPVLNAELKIDASSNTIYPSLVPLIKQMSATIKEAMGDQQAGASSQSSVKSQSQSFFQETSLNADTADTILGRCRVNMGLLIMKQEFSLSCQPIARVAATARFESIYVSVNSVLGEGNGRFLALSMNFDSLQASVRHVYSSEPTASFEVKAIIVSLMNSRHFSTTSGISAIVKMSPMSVSLNAKQVQDLLLFQEIWLQPDEEAPVAAALQPPPSDSQAFSVQRYQQVAAATAFPWNTTVAIKRMEIQLDLGPTLGRSKFQINDLWVSSKKSSDWEQSLCIGFDNIGMESQGRMSGFLELSQLKVSTSIKWSDEAPLTGQTPLIQASIAFRQLQAKASFDYQPFLVTNVEKFEFLMYNVRDETTGGQERLFSILEGNTVQVFCTSLTASQALALVQAWQRLVQDKEAAYEASLRELQRFLRRKSSLLPDKIGLQATNDSGSKGDQAEAAPISLHTDVVVSIKRVNVGAFPSSFYDHQIFKLDALNAQARFAVSFEDNKIHSALGLTLGQLRVELSGVSRPKTVNLDDLAIDEVVTRAVAARGGTILQVPRLVAGMETWQSPGSRHINYIYKSTFEGKVDVGWNYSRISFIRDMWETHSRALATRLGKPLAPLAVRITGGPGADGGAQGDSGDQQEKITAVVNVPQSKYTYTALEPPVIETPQLRDMGEATPPLEWIGLHRDRLPNVTHQIIIVTLLEIAKEVEDAYEKILGSS